MNLIIFINHLKVATLTISILWCIRKIMQTVFSNFTRFLGFKRSCTLMYSKSSRLDFHAAKYLAILSGICSYQSKFWWHKLWVALLPSSMNGAASASGSHIELNDGNIPRLVKGFFFMCTWNPTLSSSMFQNTPSDFSLSGIVSSNLLSGACCRLSFQGIEIISSLLLLTNLVNLHQSCTCL